MTSSNGNIFRVTGHLCGEFTGPGEFPAQRSVTRSFDIFFDLRPDKRLNKQWWGWWFETLSSPLIMTSLQWITLHPKNYSHWSRFIVFCCGLELIAITRHYNDVIMSAMASQITNPTIVYATVYSGTDERKHQSSASLAFVREIHRWPMNSPHKWPVTRKRFPFDDVIMVVFRIASNTPATTRLPRSCNHWWKSKECWCGNKTKFVKQLD